MGAFDDIADGVVAAITAGDSAALGELYADDVVVWHNTDGIEMTKEENLASLDALASMTTGRSFSNIRRYEIEGGFVQQHVMHLDWGSGSGDLAACLVVKVENEKIIRADEYFDGATIATFGS
ncbi:MAG: nuclear transport factor 2 family protein [Actinobacteria bacterium]|nr:nuclear transport factor 2 family protein [Ilumatobacteraceae bacterium]MDA0299740.1 nuclear transport factor 2 family protein [Actinomycetota bacterium]MDA2960969.1 nuclear transport factor 2 family protein [Actinomycetota bacterium]MDA2994588.1 nuclear transport factor 2 family protein [Actinomycetota bacterium]